MTKIELDLSGFLQTEEGQQIAKQALVEAFNNQARQYFYDKDTAISNLAYYVVENVISMNVSQMKEEVAAKVKEQITKNGGLDYFAQNKVLCGIINAEIRDNTNLIKEKVLQKLGDDETYQNVSWGLADALIKAIKGEQTK